MKALSSKNFVKSLAPEQKIALLYLLQDASEVGWMGRLLADQLNVLTLKEQKALLKLAEKKYAYDALDTLVRDAEIAR